jgi:hypothetical protein
MKTLAVALSMALMAAVAPPAQPPFDMKNWEWRCPIPLEDAPAGFARVAVTPEIFDRSTPALTDLRVLDQANHLVPHLVSWGAAQDVEGPVWKPVRVINETFEPYTYLRATLDFLEPIEKNSLRATLSGDAYLRRVRIEGSADNAAWETVADNLWLHRLVLHGTAYELNTLEFPRNTFRYLRLTVHHTPDDPRRIQIKSMEAAHREILEKEDTKPVPVAAQVAVYDAKHKQSRYELDLGYRNLPISRVSFTVDDDYFERAFEILGRNAPTEEIERRTETGWDKTEREAPWRLVHRGVLYRNLEENRVAQNTKADLINAPYRYLQVRIDEGDSPPLTISEFSVERRTATVILERRPGATYTLIGGNQKAPAPNYDLDRTVRTLRDEALPAPVAPGAIEALPQETKQAPWTERNQVLIWIVLVLAVAAVGYLIVANLKRANASTNRMDETIRIE